MKTYSDEMRVAQQYEKGQRKVLVKLVHVALLVWQRPNPFGEKIVKKVANLEI